MHMNQDDKNSDTLLEDLPPVDSTEDTPDITSIHILEDTTTAELQDIKTRQGQNAYYKGILNALYIPSVHDKFIKQENIIYKVIKDDEKSSEALAVPQALD